MNVRLQYDLDFLAGIYYDERLQLNSYSISMSLLTKTTDALNTNIAMDRLKMFMHGELANTVFINQALRERAEMLQIMGVNVTTLPEEPVDQIVGMMLYYKLNAIMEQRLIVTEVEIESCFGENLVYLHHEDEDTTDIVRPKWWDTADLLHCDAELIQQDKVVAINHTRTWRELDLAWSDNTSSTSSGNVVVFADFKRDDTE